MLSIHQGTTDKEVIATAKAAQCDEFLSELSDGYQTVIKKRFNTIGGQCQRLCIRPGNKGFSPATGSATG